ncbi:hypothetical protein M409DRAFT_26066 [Zasmidium cellare ATCC 36951]|uniref:Uncharacterized protein n=1 Tax=Zasmidium cellare ATCC 36951 TaxID=1080233 RepID=A0A6A6CC13_ZASCE|nr:uncharacterized protein M409DRAFT_26066 [Zasmidium cellare ATCC 36951]KAF2163452.1 hypothetical protein M409DRAFT_26066 [Zasmidium cellare ATCC 36951]
MSTTKFTKILTKARVGTVKRNGQDVAVSVATRTDKWFRPTEMIQTQGPRFIAVIEKNPDKITPGTKEAILRDIEHSSEEDPKVHFSAILMPQVAPDNEIPENGQSAYFYTEK